jgi:hypothetical protein
MTINTQLVRPNEKDYSTFKEYFKDVCNYLYEKYKDTYSR